jgi:hypothetical protein
MKMRWLLFLGLLVITLTAHASPEFTDAEAKKFLVQYLNEGCTPAVPVGAVLLQVGEKDQRFPEEIRKRLALGEDWTHMWGQGPLIMYAMEERGIIEIERLWNDGNDKWQEARVTLTPKGEAIGEIRPFSGGTYLCLKWGSGRVLDIVRNEEFRRGLEVFRTVMAVLQVKWTPEFQLFAQIKDGKGPSEQRKIIALLKHDPFQSKWGMVTWDVADVDEDFKTSNVTTELERR